MASTVKCLAFAQAQQAGDLIDLGAGQNHGFDRAAARAGAGLQRRRLPICGAQIGRSIEQDPALAVSGDGEAGLCARPAPACRPPTPADTPDTGNSIAENRHPPLHRARWRSGAPFTDRTQSAGSELGREIAVDFEADADFDECRSCP